MTASGGAQRPLRILLVEDEPAHAEMVRRSLEDAQVAHALAVAADGEEALAVLARQAGAEGGPLPDLILLDLRLPRIDGIEVLSRIKADEGLRHLPVIILTSSEADADVAGAFTRHIAGYLVKPIDVAKLGGILQDLGYHWLRGNPDSGE
ncbi:MAG: response regulator [Candidatus Krumholzibacteriota bacterium]|nr:response regulator [Candidatus Krumholzibacteriota bacterium]